MAGFLVEFTGQNDPIPNYPKDMGGEFTNIVMHSRHLVICNQDPQGIAETLTFGPADPH